VALDVGLDFYYFADVRLCIERLFLLERKVLSQKAA
jgi:hypothetical protein